ncbi:MAG: ATP-binding protein [Firmicutes bacterium]|uniref:ATP-binding protein n=1 Tax=Candidatus Colimorpha enterica TaxID=3083063 RepID=A0AAE3FGM0_9BACT|nr:ATP-binding protein [Candidatus Colimorpha enterica]
MDEKITVPKRILSSLISSVSAGVVPRLGAPYIAIGREAEISALLSDLEIVGEGGSAMRFVIGKYGSGKSFLIQLMRGYALERGFICADCDLSPERRLCGGKGSGIATYRELIKNMSSKTSPEGGALGPVISRWLSSVQGEVAQSVVLPGSPDFGKEISKRVFALSKKMENSVGGFDFASVINSYYRAETEGSDELKSACLRWLRGEYTTKTEAREYLSVGSLISDDNWYDYIKLWAEFVKSIGYRGFVVFIDECVNLYKITNRVSRENNYEKILSMFNDTLQGRAPGLCMIMGGTPQFLEDTRRGLFSYEALRSRLADGRFTGSGEFRDMLGPVIRLRRLSDNELFALISRLTKLHGMYYSWEPRVTEEQQAQFLREAVSRTGADTMMTPREMIRDYMSVLNILLQNPSAGFTDVVRSSASQAAAAAEETKEISLDDIEI